MTAYLVTTQDAKLARPRLQHATHVSERIEIAQITAIASQASTTKPSLSQILHHMIVSNAPTRNA
jgi:hypothetical protein